MNIDQSRYFPAELRDVWERVAPECRFSYQINRSLIIYLIVILFIIWAFYFYTVFRIQTWNWSLGLYPVVYLGFTGWLVINMLRWRAFTLRAGVVVAPKQLVWSTDGQKVHAVAWTTLNFEKLGLMEATSAKSWDVKLNITMPNGEHQQLYITRIYAKISRMESLFEQLLLRVQQTG
ncbi:MAG: hypothetical protein HUU55_12360 [Myxococcales bacterium]|nr:hypothetical protein [Myxococcales bacterium]